MNELIGNTPMIEINYRYQGKIKTIYVKLECFNITGSIKDRIAHYIYQKAIENNTIKPGMPIIEATSGNTGISFSALGAYYHHPVTIFMPDWASIERVKLMKLYGAHVELVSKEEGGFLECIKRADRLKKQVGGFCPSQFLNQHNVEAHYQTTGVEILNQIGKANVTAFVSGVGTGGTLTGIGQRLKEAIPHFNVIAIEPKGAAILKHEPVIVDHAIEGIGDGLIPEILNQELIDDIYTILDDDAVNMSRLLAQKLGLGVGISSGANLLGAIEYQKNHDGVVVTIFPDDNKKYLSTNLSKPVTFDPTFLSNQIELLDFKKIASEERSVL